MKRAALVQLCSPEEKRFKFDAPTQLFEVECFQAVQDRDPTIPFEPSGAAIDVYGNAFMVNGAHHEIQVFQKEGRLIRRFGSEGRSFHNGQLFTQLQEMHQVNLSIPLGFVLIMMEMS